MSTVYLEKICDGMHCLQLENIENSNFNKNSFIDAFALGHTFDLN